MGRSNEITVRERKLVSGVLDGKSQAQAARDAGYPPASARQAASETLKRPDIRALLHARLDAAGLDIDQGIAVLARNLNARAMGLTKDGDVVDMGWDGTTQTKALDQYWKLRNAYPNPRLDMDVNLKGAIVVLRPEDAIASDPFGDVFDGDAIDVTPE